MINAITVRRVYGRESNGCQLNAYLHRILVTVIEHLKNRENNSLRGRPSPRFSRHRHRAWGPASRK